MDVTIDNFKEVLTEFEEVIETAAFFSVDAEFTGLFTERTPPFSTPSELYQKLKTGTEDYIIVQLGITAFRTSPDNPEKFTYKSYNFYVFPQGRDQHFKCTGSSLTFLSEQNFNFNKLFQKGVSCCTQDVAKKLRTVYDERQRNRIDALEVSDERSPNFDEVPVPLEELDKLDEIRTKIKNFLKIKDEKQLTIGNSNAFQRKLMYQLIEKEFNSEITATSQVVNNQKVLVVERKWTAEQQQISAEQKNLEDEEEYRRLVGLSALLQKISESKKLIVGHNMFMDLFYLIRQFFEPLPESLKVYKKQAHKIFPNILDTKHICQEKFRSEITSSVLKNVFDTVSKPPYKLPLIEPESDEYGYKEQGKAHEAGYDSYMTGVCFLGLAKQLHIKNEEISSKCHQLRPYLNKVFVMRLTDIYYIDLTGREPKPNRDHVFHITFPEVWTQNDIVNHFRKYGSVFIRWINNTSAFVALNNRENAPILLKTITATKGVKITTFAAHLRATGAESDDDAETDAIEKAETSSTTASKRSSMSPSNQRPEKKAKLEKKKSKTQDEPTEFVKEDEWPEETFA